MFSPLSPRRKQTSRDREHSVDLERSEQLYFVIHEQEASGQICYTAPMETKIVPSFGIIPVRKTETGLELLLIHMYGSAGGTHWTFPKGHPEIGETPLQSALRECKEEVGITPVQVWSDTPLIETYSFMYKEVLIEKTVTFYIGIVEVVDVVIQPSEIKEALWVPLEQVRERLTHTSACDVFDRAQQVLRTRGLF